MTKKTLTPGGKSDQDDSIKKALDHAKDSMHTRLVEDAANKIAVELGISRESFLIQTAVEKVLAKHKIKSTNADLKYADEVIEGVKEIENTSGPVDFEKMVDGYKEEIRNVINEIEPLLERSADETMDTLKNLAAIKIMEERLGIHLQVDDSLSPDKTDEAHKKAFNGLVIQNLGPKRYDEVMDQLKQDILEKLRPAKPVIKKPDSGKNPPAEKVTGVGKKRKAEAPTHPDDLYADTALSEGHLRLEKLLGDRKLVVGQHYRLADNAPSKYRKLKGATFEVLPITEMQAKSGAKKSLAAHEIHLWNAGLGFVNVDWRHLEVEKEPTLAEKIQKLKTVLTKMFEEKSNQDHKVRDKMEEISELLLTLDDPGLLEEKLDESAENLFNSFYEKMDKLLDRVLKFTDPTKDPTSFAFKGMVLNLIVESFGGKLAPKKENKPLSEFEQFKQKIDALITTLKTQFDSWMAMDEKLAGQKAEIDAVLSGLDTEAVNSLPVEQRQSFGEKFEGEITNLLKGIHPDIDLFGHNTAALNFRPIQAQIRKTFGIEEEDQARSVRAPKSIRHPDLPIKPTRTEKNKVTTDVSPFREKFTIEPAKSDVTRKYSDPNLSTGHKRVDRILSLGDLVVGTYIVPDNVPDKYESYRNAPVQVLTAKEIETKPHSTDKKRLSKDEIYVFLEDAGQIKVPFAYLSPQTQKISAEQKRQKEEQALPNPPLTSSSADTEAPR